MTLLLQKVYKVQCCIVIVIEKNDTKKNICSHLFGTKNTKIKEINKNSMYKCEVKLLKIP